MERWGARRAEPECGHRVSDSAGGQRDGEHRHRVPGQKRITNGSNNIIIANVGVAADSAVIRIGTDGTQTSTFIAGINATTVTGSAVYISSTGQLGIAPSSRRYKQDICDMGEDSRVLQSLRPVAFRYTPNVDASGALQYGLIAEEVAKLGARPVRPGGPAAVRPVQPRQRPAPQRGAAVESRERGAGAVGRRTGTDQGRTGAGAPGATGGDSRSGGPLAGAGGEGIRSEMTWCGRRSGWDETLPDYLTRCPPPSTTSTVPVTKPFSASITMACATSAARERAGPATTPTGS